MGQITTTQNLVATKEVWHAGQSQPIHECYIATFKAIDQIAMGPNNAMIYLDSMHKQPTIT